MTYRGARSTLAGGRVKSGDRELASPARQSLIPHSGSFTEARRVGRGWERLCWLVYSGGGSGGRGHAVRGATPVI
jgi:predicted Rossmann-fold nucleotide-binding protein